MRQLLNDWTYIASGLTPIVAAAALFVAWRQLSLNRTNQRETTAKGIWREYLRLAIDRPDLAFATHQEDDRQKYEWFVAYLLWGAEEILNYDNTWERNIVVNLRYHRNYFRDPNFIQNELPLYSEKVQMLVRRIAT